jgi:hypothetical protein
MNHFVQIRDRSYPATAPKSTAQFSHASDAVAFAHAMVKARDVAVTLHSSGEPMVRYARSGYDRSITRTDLTAPAVATLTYDVITLTYSNDTVRSLFFDNVEDARDVWLVRFGECSNRLDSEALYRLVAQSPEVHTYRIGAAS